MTARDRPAALGALIAILTIAIVRGTFSCLFRGECVLNAAIGGHNVQRQGRSLLERIASVISAQTDVSDSLAHSIALEIVSVMEEGNLSVNINRDRLPLSTIA